MKKIPIGYMRPLVVDGEGTVLVDKPVAAWKDKDKYDLCSVDSLENNQVFLKRINSIREPYLNTTEEGQELIRKIQNGKSFLESKGPFFCDEQKYLQETVDFRPWYELEKDYDRFLVVNQYYWVEHNLNPFEDVTEESIRVAGDGKLLECLQNGRATLLVHIPWESGWWNHGRYLDLISDLERLKIQNNVVIVCPQSKNVTEVCKHHYRGLRFESINNFELFPWDLEPQSYKTFQNFENLKQKWLEINRFGRCISFFCNVNSPTAPRISYYTVLNNIVPKNKRLVNLRNSYGFSKEIRKKCYQDALLELTSWEEENGKTEESQILREELSKNLIQEPKLFSVESLLGKPANWVEYQPWRLESFVEVFGETRSINYNLDDPGSQCWFITEKTTKPISSLKPFIVIANYGYLDYLHSIGYQTFDRWWDESYDKEQTWIGRVLKIQTLLKTLSQYSEEQMRSMVLEMEEVLIHNFNVRERRILTRGQICLDTYKRILGPYTKKRQLI